MNPANQLDLLAIRNETFLRDIDFREEIESTNTLAVELAKTDCDTPLMIIAERQVAGRGRSENSWWSSAGALTFTLLLDLPVRSVADIGPFSLTAGLAVCQTLERFAPAADLALKWPNDVYCNNKKICGILIERPIADEPRVAVGIGINVNNSLQDAPVALRSTATSMADELESDQPLTQVLIQCLQLLEQLSRDHLRARDRILDQWRAYCMLTGREIAVDQGGQQISGTCRGIDPDGALLVEQEGITRRCIAGAVSSF